MPAPRDVCGGTDERTILVKREVAQRAEALRKILGDYRVYVYDGPEFDNVSSALPLPAYNVFRHAFFFTSI